mgnify:CR=1 FL=1
MWCFPEYSSRRFDHDQQGTKGAVDDVLAVRVEVPHAGHPALEEFGDQRGVDRDHS